MKCVHIGLFLTCIASMLTETQGRQCPLDCYCKNKFVDCSSLMDFPLDLALDTERIRLSHMNIGEIPKHAFSYLPNVTLIEFEQSNIGIIAGCAFMNIASLEEIVFDKTVIGNIESYAFNSLSNMKRLEFFKSRIGRLKSFAFYRLSEILSVNMVETNVLYFYSNALYDLHNISVLFMANNNISDFNTDAFRDVQVDSLQISSNSFWNMHCGVLDVMLQSAKEFSFDSNTFYCNCSIHWMLSTSGLQRYSSIIPGSACHGPDKLNETSSLSHLKFSDLNCKKIKVDAPLTCNEVKVKILNPTCGASHRHGGHPSGDTHDGGDDANAGVALKLTVSIFIVLFLYMF